jgi:hypothetical protein
MYDFAHMVMMMPVLAILLTMLGVPSTFTAFLGNV